MVFANKMISFKAFYDDEDDIMIVEEKDALDVPDQIEFVAEEVIIEETVGDDDYTEIICVSPKYINEMSNITDKTNQYDKETGFVNELPDNSKNEILQAATMSTLEENTQTEPIYLSDSLSCFDSDSDTQHSGIPDSLEKLDTSKNIELQLSQHTDEDDDVQPLNESADDVIIVPNCTDTIEIDRSDTDDESFAGTVSLNTCIESDSQPSVDSNAQENNKNRIESVFNNSHLCDTTTDADDDSSEVERRYVRSRRDNVERKNYSCRRNYAKRKIRNNIDTPNSEERGMENENDLNERTGKIETIECSNSEKFSSEQTFKIDKMTLPSMVQECNTTDGTDEEVSFNLMKAKAVRTYNRKNISSPKSISKIVPIKDNDKSESDCQIENVKSSYHAAQECSNSESIQIPRKRGRPRKKAVSVDYPKSNDESAKKPNDKSNETTQNSSPKFELPFDVPDVKINDENTRVDILLESNSTIASTSEFIEEVPTVPIREATVINEISNGKSYAKIKIEMTQTVIKNGIEENLLNEEHVSNTAVEDLGLHIASCEYLGALFY